MRLWPVLCLAVAPPPAAADIVNNGSFEVGAGTDADGWNELEIAGGGASAATDREFGGSINIPAYDGDYLMFMSVNGASDFGPVSEIQQQTSVGSIIGGNTYEFSFASIGNAGPGTVAFYEVSWFDGDGSNGGGPQGSATGLQTFTLGGDWAITTVSDLVAPASADSMFIQIRLVTGAFDGATGWAGIDAVTVTPTPAPGALALLGLAGMAGRRRRG